VLVEMELAAVVEGPALEQCAGAWTARAQASSLATRASSFQSANFFSSILNHYH
jgi:hypothetical protein